jgi:uncharacterized protein
MYARILKYPKNKSFFLFGPRGTGKSSWVKSQFPEAQYFDLLESDLFHQLNASPQRLSQLIPPGEEQRWVVLDEIQKIPEILDEVHRLIESRKLKFILTGSSARKLKKKGVNLLAGRALHVSMYPLTAIELGNDFNFEKALKFGQLPSIAHEDHPKAYLQSYVSTYLKEEIQQEGLTRNLSAFIRFLEAASFSQGSVLNMSAVSRECSVERKVVEDYFSILEDLMIGTRLPVFTKKAKRKTIAHSKFYFFDVGVYRTLRPTGPLDQGGEITGVALESLVFQELKAINSYLELDYTLYYWRTSTQLEVDFILYGEKGIKAFEVKLSDRVRPEDLTGLKAFLEDYPMAKGYLLYGGSKAYSIENIQIIPVEEALKKLPSLLA